MHAALTELPNLNLTDLNMPNVEGFEIIKRLRRHVDLGAKVSSLALRSRRQERVALATASVNDWAISWSWWRVRSAMPESYPFSKSSPEAQQMPRRAILRDRVKRVDLTSTHTSYNLARVFCRTTLLAMNLATGTRLGPNEILSLLGAGGKGEVYLA